eukprot:scaffold124036_cov66-Phaeocystis_antarctica.AAC.2
MAPCPCSASAQAHSNVTLCHGVCLAAAHLRVSGEVGFRHRGRGQCRSPLEVRGRLLELRRRARPLLHSSRRVLAGVSSTDHRALRDKIRGVQGKARSPVTYCSQQRRRAGPSPWVFTGGRIIIASTPHLCVWV